MTALDQELIAVATEAFPETPDLVLGVRARLEAGAGARAVTLPRPPRRWLIAVAVAVAVAVAAAFAVPDARSTILRWFGIGGVSVQSVATLPVVPPDRPLIIGVPVSLQQAQARVGFRVVVPAQELGAPDGIYVGHFNVDEVTLLYGRPRAVEALLTEVGGELNVAFAQKLVVGSGHITGVSVNGKPALWIAGAPHEFLFVGRNGATVSAPLRLDKNVLLWQRGDVLFRLEGDFTLAEALRVARSMA